MKRYVIPLIAVTAVLTTTAASCEPEAVRTVIAAVQTDDPAPSPAPERQAIYLSPGSTEMCNLLGGDPIPCGAVLDVCVDNGDGTWSSKFGDNGIHESYGLGRCTPLHPTWREVCRWQPQYAASYGYTPEECADA